MTPRAAAVRSALLWHLRQYGPSTSGELAAVVPPRVEWRHSPNVPCTPSRCYVRECAPALHHVIECRQSAGHLLTWVDRDELLRHLAGMENAGAVLSEAPPDAAMTWRLAPAAIDDGLSSAFWTIVGPLTPDTTSVLRWTEER